MDLKDLINYIKNVNPRRFISGNYTVERSFGILRITSQNINYDIQSIILKLNGSRISIEIQYNNGKEKRISRYLKRIRECLKYNNLSKCLRLEEKVFTLLEKILSENNG